MSFHICRTAYLGFSSLKKKKEIRKRKSTKWRKGGETGGKLRDPRIQQDWQSKSVSRSLCRDVIVGPMGGLCSLRFVVCKRLGGGFCSDF